MISDADEPKGRSNLTLTRLRKFFCDAERVLDVGGESWLVGYRRRTHSGGQTQDGMHTWFRSESGEVRYATGMLQFRHMPQGTLCEHLAAAMPAAGATARVRWAK